MKVDIDYLKKVLITTEKATGCEAAICGGYLRDLDHGIESKDLDVFVMEAPLSTSFECMGSWHKDLDHDASALEVMKSSLDGLLQEVGLVDDGSDIVAYKNPQWFQNSASGSNMRDDVIGVKKYYCADLDFIFMDASNWKDVTHNFDVSICQIMCRFEDGKLNVYASDSYMSYKKGEGDILRFFPIPTCDSHVARIKAKFGKVKGVYSTDDTLSLVGELTEEGVVYAGTE